MKCFLLGLLFSLSFTGLQADEIHNDILVFKSKEEAVSYSFRSFWDYVPAESQKTAYQKADAIVERLWPYFCEQYPECEKYPRPELLMSYTRGSGSFGMEHEGKLRQTNAIVLSWEIHDQPKDLEFVIAHEMIHYFEKHAESQDLRDEIYSIKRQAYDKCLDYPYPLEELKDNLIDIIDAMNYIGDKPYLVPAELGLPLEGDLGLIFERMIQKTNRYPGCTKLSEDLTYFRNKIANGNYLYETNDRVKAFMSLADKCFELYPGNLLKAAAVSLDKFTAGPDPSSWAEYDSMVFNDGNELERLRRIRNSRYQYYLELSRKLVGPQLRYYTEEDDADIKALNILLKSGRRNMEQSVDYLLVDLPIKEQIRCRSILQKNEEPNYGPLNRPHHDECWRIWRAKKVEDRFLRQLADKNNQETSR